jgi:hypothetical protein
VNILGQILSASLDKPTELGSEKECERGKIIMNTLPTNNTEISWKT